MRLYSTANERGLNCNSFFVCLAANCSRDGCVPSQKNLFNLCNLRIVF
ncbi:MAG: hypothetical protein LBP59_15460 [Planctomycetaceae bacterium]|nr:hypothetical protein [Planctomycetaceae bacterium]